MYPMIDPALADAGLGDAEDDDFDAIESPDSQLPDHRYLDRELSWLAFNQRVLELAEDPAAAAELERVPTTSRSSPANLDEFFMVRVAGLKRRIATGLAVHGQRRALSPRQVLEDDQRARRTSSWTCVTHAAWISSRCEPALAESEGMDARATGTSSGTTSRSALSQVLPGKQIFPVLTAARGRPGAPVPVHLGALAQPRGPSSVNPQTGQGSTSRASRSRRMLPRYIAVDARGRPSSQAAAVEMGPTSFVPLEERHLPAPRPPVPRHGGARAPHVPGHAQRGRRGRGGREPRTSSRRWRS